MILSRDGLNVWDRVRFFSSFASFDFSKLAFYHQRLHSIFEYYVIYLLQVWAFFDAFHKIQNCCVEWENLYIFSQVVWGLEKFGFDSTLLANDKDTTTFLRPILILEPSVVNNKKDFLTHKYKALALGFKNILAILTFELPLRGEIVG